jgi:hypothetical protein
MYFFIYLLGVILRRWDKINYTASCNRIVDESSIENFPEDSGPGFNLGDTRHVSGETE